VSGGLLYQVDAETRRKAAAVAVMRLRARQQHRTWTPYDHQVPPPGDWQTWLLLGGRGSGKTDAGAHAVDGHALGVPCLPGRVPHRIAIVSTTHDDAVDTCVRGESGLLAANPTVSFKPGAQLSADLTWPNGAEAQLFGTFAPEDVERFRGPQHCLIWGDEIASWRKLDEAWDMLAFGLRLGEKPRWILTTTPKARKRLLEVIADPHTVVTHARTSDNPALAEEVRAELYRRYGGTTLGRQELDAELLTDVAGALWRREIIEALRRDKAPDLVRIVVAIDPSATSTESADEAGIVVAGVDERGEGWVLADYSLRGAPIDWARIAVDAYRVHRADRIVAETNNGGEMVAAILRTLDPAIAYRSVTASRGKQTRAEPISALYEQGRVRHAGTFERLEDQMCQWVPGDRSPDRMDALVWALTDLMIPDENPWASLTVAGGVA
jgi:phage terminase large subunit-like protein